MMKKESKIAQQIEHYLFHSTSTVRSLVLTVSLFLLFFIFFVIARFIFYSNIEMHSLLLLQQRDFIISFLIIALPIMLLLLFKLNIWTKFWDNTDKPHLIDYLLFGSIILFLYFSFTYLDITWTSVHGKVMLDMIWRGMNIMDFYDYNYYYNYNLVVYQPTLYIFFAIWSIPVKIFYFIAGFPPIDVDEFHRITGLTLWWYKLLPTLFYLGCAFIIYKISILLNVGKNNSKWLCFIWFTFPMATFSQFIIGQYDSIGLFFELLMILSFMQRKLLKASLFCMIAVTCKVFPIFIFVPLLLIFEKRVLRIIGYTFIAVSGYLFFNMIFSGSVAYTVAASSYKFEILNRLFTVGINHKSWTISLFMLSFVLSCVFTYLIDTYNKDKYIIHKYIMYIPLLIYTSIFSFIQTHPCWILLLTPYFVINIFLNNNKKILFFIVIGANLANLLFNASHFLWVFDIHLMNNGIFPALFGIPNIDDSFLTVSQLLNFNGRIPTGFYFSFFVSFMVVYLILSFPNEKNINISKNAISNPFMIKRDIVWINGMVVLVFSALSILMFFSIKNYQTDKIDVISKISVIDHIQDFEQNSHDIISINSYNDKIIFRCGNIDPQFSIPLESFYEKSSGIPFIEIIYTNSHAGKLQVFYDYGSDFSETYSYSINIKEVLNETNIRLPIIGWNDTKKLGRIRIDPPDNTEFGVKNIKILSAIP